jgi:phage/plasmid primase-like uncharacterized protein
MTAPGIIICSPATFPIRAIMRCPTCKKRRRFAGRDAAWWGVTWTCCACGDSFGDGERLMRPATRGWRTEARAKARATWEEAGRRTRAEYRTWIQDQTGVS